MLRRVRGEALEMIAEIDEGMLNFRKQGADFFGPTFEAGFARPDSLSVVKRVRPLGIVRGFEIAEQAHIEKIRSAGQKFERAFRGMIEIGGVGPSPADAVFLEKMCDARQVPGGVSELNGEAKIARE